MNILPTYIPFAAVEAFLEQLGISVRDTQSVTFGVRAVTIEQARRIGDGIYPGDGTYEIEYDRGQQP